MDVKHMIKLIAFDLDGVLIEAKKLHFDSFNQALYEEHPRYVITEEDHLSVFDGLKTREKLMILSERRGLPINRHDNIWNRKQEITSKNLNELVSNTEFLSLISELKQEGLFIACCSNSIRESVILSLTKLGIIDLFDLILSNEDIKNSKPHPEIYWRAMTHFNVLPEETIVVEDSPYGLLAAFRSNAHILRVKNTKDLSIEKIKQKMYNASNMKMKWRSDNLNVLIPMAGAGSRFEKEGYKLPKPLIDVNGKPMIQTVVDSLNIEATYIFIVQKSHREKYNLDVILNQITPNCKIVEVDGVTEGAACTTLLAKDYIDSGTPLIIANSDQYINWNSTEFMYKMNESNADAGILSFESTHPKWSYAKLDNSGYVTEVAEKNPISNIATVGVYYWKNGSDYVKYAEQMISENIRVNNEFYVCPVFNHAISDGKKIRTFKIDDMWGLGTPDDLIHYLANNK